MSAAAILAEFLGAEPMVTDGIEALYGPQECPECHHTEFLHETLLTSIGAFAICHEATEDGECFRVRHSQGIPFGACRSDVK